VPEIVNRVTINLEALEHNLRLTNDLMERHGASWTLVTKVLCGHEESLRALHLLGVRSMGDSRLENIRAIRRLTSDFEAWYLRVPGPSTIEEVAAISHVSLNSEIETIESLNHEAARREKTHHVIIMIELGDLREGILPGSLIKFYEQVFRLPRIEVLGIGANLGCLAGAVPTVDQFMQLALYRELLELKFERKLPMISAGSSASLPLVLSGQLPKIINHFRIGEAVFLGTDLIGGGTLPGYRDDVVLLKAEIAEMKEKGLVPLGETTSMAPFLNEVNEETTPGQRGYRALVSVGHLDTDISGLSPVDPAHRIAGASSDITVVNLGEESGGLSVGDAIEFRVNYSALLRLMSGKYIAKEVVPPLGEFADGMTRKPSGIEPVVPRQSLNRAAAAKNAAGKTNPSAARPVPPEGSIE
jgi:ornithine racemase